MNEAETRLITEIMDPAEFKQLLDQFGKEAMARAEAKGYNKAISDAIKITLPSRIPAATKEWLLDRFRGLEKKVPYR
jgi:hypothetical protein